MTSRTGSAALLQRKAPEEAKELFGTVLTSDPVQKCTNVRNFSVATLHAYRPAQSTKESSSLVINRLGQQIPARALSRTIVYVTAACKMLAT